MKIKRWIASICAIITLSSSMTVFANGVDIEATVKQSYGEAPIIEMLTPEEAESLYKELYGDINHNQRSALGTCEIGLSNNNGKLLVVYSTACRGTASKIGVRNFTLQHKDGLFWSNIAIRNEYSEDTDAFFGGFYIANPVIGRKYRANCTHYAVINGSETSMYAATEDYAFQ